jgi:hypothetical protein
MSRKEVKLEVISSAASRITVISDRCFPRNQLLRIRLYDDVLPDTFWYEPYTIPKCFCFCQEGRPQ